MNSHLELEREKKYQYLNSRSSPPMMCFFQKGTSQTSLKKLVRLKHGDQVFK